MTDTRGGGTPHVDPDVLADLQEGLLDGPAADAADRAPRRLRRPAAPTWPRSTRCGTGSPAAPDVGPAPGGPGGPAGPGAGRRRGRAGAASPARPSSRCGQPEAKPAPRHAAAAGRRGPRPGAGRRGDRRVGAEQRRQRQQQRHCRVARRPAATRRPRRADADTFPVTATGRDWTDGYPAGGGTRARQRRASRPTAAGRLGGPSAADEDSTSRRQRHAAGSSPTHPAARLAGGPALADCATALAGGAGDPGGRGPGQLRGPAGGRACCCRPPTIPATVDVYVVKPGVPAGRVPLLRPRAAVLTFRRGNQPPLGSVDEHDCPATRAGRTPKGAGPLWTTYAT